MDGDSGSENPKERADHSDAILRIDRDHNSSAGSDDLGGLLEAVKRAKDALNMESTHFEALDGAFSQHQAAYTMVNETYAGHNFEGDYSYDL
ncbi:hypothetical protein EV182_008419, partial [Spiromyces aspiralis]